ncbi:hypothetical protein BC830DRAFT_1132240 [Chytriomyces sp. MP71]|nr:hypothetical protein BC830DRAFT_1132240 [Chytriomyces sp. MP71]
MYHQGLPILRVTSFPTPPRNKVPTSAFPHIKMIMTVRAPNRQRIPSKLHKHKHQPRQCVPIPCLHHYRRHIPPDTRNYHVSTVFPDLHQQHIHPISRRLLRCGRKSIPEPAHGLCAWQMQRSCADTIFGVGGEFNGK